MLLLKSFRTASGSLNGLKANKKGCTIFKNKMRKSQIKYSLTLEQLLELEKRNQLHDSGKATYYTMEEMRKKVLQRIPPSKNKS